MNITEFLLARVAEDEAGVRDSRMDRDVPEWWMPDWLTPGRLLAECEAKRRIIEMHTEKWEECRVCFDRDMSTPGDYVFEDWPCLTLRALAQPYADHPDFDPKWIS